MLQTVFNKHFLLEWVQFRRKIVKESREIPYTPDPVFPLINAL